MDEELDYDDEFLQEQEAVHSDDEEIDDEVILNSSRGAKTSTSVTSGETQNAEELLKNSPVTG